jgi:hypothetical protein
LPSSSVNIGGDVYTGVPLWNLLTPTVSSVLSGYVIASGTDGYEVLYSLAELDPNFGAPLDLVPYADTQGAFPSDGFARIVIPGDNHQGRYVSNLDSIQVAAVPEPGTFILIGSLFAFVILGDRLRRARYPTSAKVAPLCSTGSTVPGRRRRACALASVRRSNCTDGFPGQCCTFQNGTRVRPVHCRPSES